MGRLRLTTSTQDGLTKDIVVVNCTEGSALIGPCLGNAVFSLFQDIFESEGNVTTTYDMSRQFPTILPAWQAHAECTPKIGPADPGYAQDRLFSSPGSTRGCHCTVSLPERADTMCAKRNPRQAYDKLRPTLALVARVSCLITLPSLGNPHTAV